MRDVTGNLPPFPRIIPDYPAPIVRHTPDGVRELSVARWGTVVVMKSLASILKGEGYPSWHINGMPALSKQLHHGGCPGSTNQ